LRLNEAWARGSRSYLRVPRLPAVETDIYGAPRPANLTFAGAFEPSFDIGTDVEQPTASSGSVRIVTLGKQLTLISDTPIQSVRIFDVQGRLILSEVGVSTVYATTIENGGVYIIETVTDTGIREVQRAVVM